MQLTPGPLSNYIIGRPGLGSKGKPQNPVLKTAVNSFHVENVRPPFSWFALVYEIHSQYCL